METKNCFKCKKDLPRSSFTKNSRSKDGLFSYCKECHKEWRTARAQNRRKEIGDPYANEALKKCIWCELHFPRREFTRDMYSSDGLRPHCVKCERHYKLKAERKRGVKPFVGQTDLVADGKKRCKQCKQVKAFHNFSLDSSRKDRLNIFCKGCESEYNKSRNETVREAAKRYRSKLKRNPESISYWKARVRVRTNKGIDAYALKEKYYTDPHCEYCDIAFGHPDEMWIDHKIPRACGGDSVIQNVALACPTCNRAKGDMPYDKFKKYLEALALRVVDKMRRRTLHLNERSA